MKNILGFTLLIVMSVYMIFQPILLYKYSLVEENINIALNEALKESAVKGRVDEQIKNRIKQNIYDVYRIDLNQIIITGNETYTTRGNYIQLSISVPKPNVTVVEMFRFFDEQQFLTTSKIIMSEYVP